MPFNPPRRPPAAAHRRRRFHFAAPARPAVRANPVIRTLPWALLAVVALAGCGAPPELNQPATDPPPAATPATPTSPPATPPGRPPTGAPFTPPAGAAPATSDAGLVATACRNGPTGQRVIDLLRGRAAVLPDNVRVRVRTGPLCAADWQYTVLEVTGHEELQVVTRRRAGTLQLVTAGTDVCSIEVRATGPAGIRTLACDAGPVLGPGA